jgi:thiamine-phosphate pyrophosphorylase
MSDRCLLYYITDRTAFPGDEPTRRRHLLDKIAEATSAGINYIQLREKDLPARNLESLAKEAIRIISGLNHPNPLTPDLWPPPPALLINSRTDIALAAQAAGVHLRSSDVSPQEVRAVWGSPCGADTPARLSPRDPLISVACHSPAEVMQAAADEATLALFAPVFEKKDSPASQPAGLDQLRHACRSRIPVLALGGVTLQNAKLCLETGAAGIAAIRLFQENEIAPVVRTLRSS